MLTVRSSTIETGVGLLALILFMAFVGPSAQYYWDAPTSASANAPRAEMRAPDIRPSGFDPYAPRIRPIDIPVVIDLRDITLHGIRSDGAHVGIAIMSLAGSEQMSLGVGDTIGSGIVVSAIDASSVAVARGDERRRIGLGGFLPGARTAAAVARALHPRPPEMIVQSPPPPATALLSDIQYQPHVESGRVSGLVVQPAGTGAAFGYTGLFPGDLILAVDGRAIDSPDEARRASRDLRAGGKVVDVKRSNKIQTVRL